MTAPAGQARDRDRKHKILSAARRLFRERGFHSVGIDDVGAAAGISGPGVYRHFAGKQELLIAALPKAEEMWGRSEGREDITLEVLVRRHVRFAVNNASLLALWYQEQHNLPEQYRRSQQRLHRRYVDEWVVQLRARRADLDEAEARVRVTAAIELAHRVDELERLLDSDRLEAVLTQMTLAALDA
jgi:AcrR family transcriptional regulator